jgi:hypothetical protein
LQSLENVRIWNISLFTTYELPGSLSLSSSLGLAVLSSDVSGTLATYTTNTNASYRFAKAVIAVAILQDYNQTFLNGNNFGITLTRSYTGSFSYALTPFIDTSVRASYSDNEFTGVGNNRSSPNSNVFSALASVSWRVQRWLTAGLDYTYTRYGSVDGSGQAASENRFSLRLTASF